MKPAPLLRQAQNARFLLREGGPVLAMRQFSRWCLTRRPVRETRDAVRRRRLGWRS